MAGRKTIDYITELNPKGFRSIWKPGQYKYFQRSTNKSGGSDTLPYVVWRVGILKSELAEFGGSITITANSSLFTMAP